MNVETDGLLHGYALAPDPRLVSGAGEDEIAQLPEPGVDPQSSLLPAIEVDAPAPEPHRCRGSALRAHHARGTAAGPDAGSSPLDDDHPFGALSGGKIRCPAADSAGSNHDEVRAVVCHRAIIVRRGRPLTLRNACQTTPRRALRNRSRSLRVRYRDRVAPAHSPAVPARAWSVLLVRRAHRRRSACRAGGRPV